MGSKPLILIVDDDRKIREALDARLSLAGFEVSAAGNARMAVECFDRKHPDAAIVDIELPDSDGLGVCEHIRECGSTIPVFILTGSDASIVRNHLEQITSAVGATRFITKPYDGKALVMTLQSALRHNSSTLNPPGLPCST